jgi:4-hydroxythreonine-4-phosphate dehydrogenase
VITPGDPRGIGPEVAVRALAEREARGDRVDAVVIGDLAALRREADRIGATVTAVGGVQRVASGIAAFDPGDRPEPVEVASIRAAVEACRSGAARGLVTGPIHKARLAARGFPYAGHTDFLGALCGVERPVMAFVGGRLRVALVTVHLPLRRVADAVTVEGVLHTIRESDRALRDQLGVKVRRIGVCGLNPHAGDDGLLGDEEIRVIGPAVEAARAEGIDAIGPISAETAFRRAADGQLDLVVAMYHDQGLAPLKLVDFGQSVNWTLGLPIVRTSVDHGTADDIVGKGIADVRSMHAAIALAEELTGTR